MAALTDPDEQWAPYAYTTGFAQRHWQNKVLEARSEGKALHALSWTPSGKGARTFVYEVCTPLGVHATLDELILRVKARHKPWAATPVRQLQSYSARESEPVAQQHSLRAQSMHPSLARHASDNSRHQTLRAQSMQPVRARHPNTSSPPAYDNTMSQFDNPLAEVESWRLPTQPQQSRGLVHAGSSPALQQLESAGPSTGTYGSPGSNYGSNSVCTTMSAAQLQGQQYHKAMHSHSSSEGGLCFLGQVSTPLPKHISSDLQFDAETAAKQHQQVLNTRFLRPSDSDASGRWGSDVLPPGPKLVDVGKMTSRRGGCIEDDEEEQQEEECGGQGRKRCNCRQRAVQLLKLLLGGCVLGGRCM